jgi:hypothetical protein
VFGLPEALMSFTRRQVGLRTDAASATGSLHAKVAYIAEKDIVKNGSAIKSIQRGTLVLSGLSATASISEVNVNKTMLNLVGASSKSKSVSGTPATGHHFVRLVLTSGTTVSATREASDADATVSYEVIEFY